MILKVYTLYDAKAGAYLTPFFLPNDQMAIRQFASIIGGESLIGQFPQDYTLYGIGEYNDALGELLPGALEPIMNGGDMALTLARELQIQEMQTEKMNG